MRGVHDAVCCAEIEVISPRDNSSGRVQMSHLHAGVPFWWIARRDGFIIHIGVINCTVGVDGDGWIGALLLRNRARKSELRPCGGRSRTERAALLATALIDRKPNCAIRRNM